jgi:hypothetical protein
MKNILKMTSVAVTGMTLFSYLAGKFYKERFSEPAVLNEVLYPREGKDNKKHYWTGYAIHWLIGLIFSSVYKLFWDKTKVSSGPGNSMLGGLLNGIIGIGGWHAFFKMRHHPSVSLKKYYLQLLAAHLVFGFLNGMMYRPDKRRGTGRS